MGGGFSRKSTTAENLQVRPGWFECSQGEPKPKSSVRIGKGKKDIPPAHAGEVTGRERIAKKGTLRGRSSEEGKKNGSDAVSRKKKGVGEIDRAAHGG